MIVHVDAEIQEGTMQYILIKCVFYWFVDVFAGDIFVMGNIFTFIIAHTNIETPQVTRAERMSHNHRIAMNGAR